jgi:hypothetical protein
MPIDPRVLRHAAAFQLLDDDELSELAAHVDEVSFGAGETIFRAGDPDGVMHEKFDRLEQRLLPGTTGASPRAEVRR